MPGLVDAMTARLAHRGPDDASGWQGPDVHLGFRRLAIIDPTHGRQPVTNEDGTIVALCNGEIYNHADQRAALAPLGHRFASMSDAEVVPHLYEAHGPAFVDCLRGKFAVAVHDADRRRLVLARDPLGLKPLYYVDLPSGFYFASELKCLLLAPDLVPAVDRQSLDWLLAFKHIPGDATLVSGIRFLEPGHRLLYDIRARALAVERYYEIPRRPMRATLAEAAVEVGRRLDASVRARLMSDVPLAVSLSGGLDSSAVVASVARQTDRPPQTYSVYAGDRVNELGYARLVAERYRTDHHEVIVEPDALDRIVPTVMWHLEEPMSISEVPTYYLGQAVSGRVKVLLCGEGADELFGGYKRFAPIDLAARAPRVPTSLLTWGYVRGLNGLTRRDRDRLYATDQRPYNGGDSNAWLDAELAAPGEAVVNRFLRYELSQQLRSQTKRLDKLTMAHGVEARCPFLDPDLVDYVANLPASLKVRGFREKVLLKAAMADRLPPAVIARRKFGFSNPVVPLFRTDFGDLVRDALRGGRDVLAPYFALDAVDRLFDQIGRAPVWWRQPEMQLFHVYLFLRWHEVFIQGRLPERPRDAAMIVRGVGAASDARSGPGSVPRAGSVPQPGSAPWPGSLEKGAQL